MLWRSGQPAIVGTDVLGSTGNRWEEEKMLNYCRTFRKLWEENKKIFSLLTGKTPDG